MSVRFFSNFSLVKQRDHHLQMKWKKLEYLDFNSFFKNIEDSKPRERADPWPIPTLALKNREEKLFQ